MFKLLYRDPHLVAIDKPAGFQVHPPEDPTHRVSDSTNCLFLLRKQLEQYLYPVHRLDRATSGVVVYALSQEAASVLGTAFQNREVHKVYYAVVRGWTDDQGEFDDALKAEGEGQPAMQSLTRFVTLSRIELSTPVGRYKTARYSLVEVEPVTGRKHQIRRHFANRSHPLIGDSVYGDLAHNRFFQDKFSRRMLYLRAHAISFKHPTSGVQMQVSGRWNGAWHSIFDLFGVCPFGV